MSWYNQSYRHSLARKGIKTSHRRSMALFERDTAKSFAEAFKSPSEKYDQGHELSRMAVGRVKGKLQSEMAKMENAGYLTLEDNRRFMEDHYATLEKQFMDRTINANQFKDEVDRAYRLFFQHHRKKHNLLDFGKQEVEPSLFEPGEAKGTGILGF